MSDFLAGQFTGCSPCLMNSFTESIPLKSRIAGIFLLTLLSSVVYFNSLQGAFQFDDRNLLDKEWVADLESFHKNVKFSSFQNRPILLWTFAANNHIDPQHTFGFHLANLMLHILVTVLIFFILFRVQYFSSCEHGSPIKENYKLLKIRRSGTLIFPLAAALIFAMHPVNTDSVAYISSRSSLLATFFYLLTLYLFTETLVSIRSLKQRILLGLFIIHGIYFAIGSKLIAVTLPIIMILWFLVFFFSRHYPGLSERIFSLKMILVYGCAGIIFIIFSNFYDVLYLPKDQGLELFGRIPYLLVQAKVVIFYYLKSFFLPFNLNVDSGFPFSTLSTDWKIAFSIILIIGIILMVLKWGNIWIKLGSVWFFLTLIPTSTLVPLNDLAVEHRMYLPMSLGLCLVAGWLISNSNRVNQMRSVIFILFICGLLTTTRNEVWVSEIKLWSDSVLKNPNSPRVHNNLGKAYFEKGDLDTARIHLEKSVSRIPSYLKTQYNIGNADKFFGKANFAEPHYNLASVYLDLGQLDDAETEYRTALALKSNYYSAELGMGSVKNMKGQYDIAIDHYLKSITLMRQVTGQSDYALARLNLGEVYGKTQRFDQAIVELTRAVKAEPTMIAGHFNLGTAYMLIGSYDKAENFFKTCLNLNQNYEPALFNLARVYQKKNLWEKSNNILEEFLKITGPNSAAYSAMALNNMMAGNIKQATMLYEKILDLKPNHEGALVNLAKIYYHLEEKEISRSYLEQALKLELSQTQVKDLDQLLKKLSTL